MKLKFLLLILIALLPQLSQAQGSSLIIISDGGKFLLFLNGAQQNSLPQTHLRVDGVPPANYDAKIVFEDKAKGQLEKRIPVTDPKTGTPLSVVYTIKNENGEMKLVLLTSQPAEQRYITPADVYVIQYGQPDAGNAPPQTTPPDNNKGGFINITPVTAPPANNNSTETEMNMSFGDPNADRNANPSAKSANLAPCGSPMDGSKFKLAKEAVKSANYEDAKFASATNILTSNCVSTEQVVQVCQLFGFEQSKLNFAKLAYSKTTDPANYSKVVAILTSGSGKADLNNFLKNAGK